MNKVELDVARAKHLSNQNTKKGIDLFEKYIGGIKWLHPNDTKHSDVGDKKYRVINKMGEVVFESDKISDIAKEFCLSVSRVANSVNSVSLIKGEYLVERCGNE